MSGAKKKQKAEETIQQAQINFSILTRSLFRNKTVLFVN